MKETVEVEFVPHCDGENCALGIAEFNCPACNKLVQDYGDLWWGWDTPKEEYDSSESSCEHCEAKFMLTKTEEFHTYKVTPIP